MPIHSVWSDEYTGPRYTYYSPLRPIPATLLPEGYTVVVGSTSAPDLSVITTTKPLPQRFIDQWSLELREAQKKGGEK